VKEAFAADENLDLGNLPTYWRAIDAVVGRIYALPDTQPTDLTARAFDQAQPAGNRVYIEVDRFLTVALDNHQALLALLEARGATLWAPWSLLRPIFETSFLAAWILDPIEGRTRRIRGLRCEVEDARQQRSHKESFRGFPEVQRLLAEEARRSESEGGAMWTYRREANALQISWTEARRKVGLTDEIRARSLAILRSQPELQPFMESTWRTLSGFEHGLGWALLRNTDRTVEAEIPGGAVMKLTMNDAAFVTAAKSCYLLMLTALNLYERRATRAD
jgi:hypothetical protein